MCRWGPTPSSDLLRGVLSARCLPPFASLSQRGALTLAVGKRRAVGPHGSRVAMARRLVDRDGGSNPPASSEGRRIIRSAVAHDGPSGGGDSWGDVTSRLERSRLRGTAHGTALRRWTREPMAHPPLGPTASRNGPSDRSPAPALSAESRAALQSFCGAVGEAQKECPDAFRRAEKEQIA